MSSDPVEPTVPPPPTGPTETPAPGAALDPAEAAQAKEVAAALAALPGHLAEAPFDPDPDSPMFQLLVEIARAARDLVGADDYDACAAQLLRALGDGVRPCLPWLWAAFHPGLTPWGIVHDAALRAAPGFVADLRAVAAETGARADLAVEVRRLESLEREMRGEPDPEPRHVRIEFPPEVLERPAEEQVQWARDRYAALAGVAAAATPSWRRFTREELALATEAARALFGRPLARLIADTVAAGRLFMPPAYWTLVALGARRAGAAARVADALTQLGAALRAGIPLDLWPLPAAGSPADAGEGPR